MAILRELSRDLIIKSHEYASKDDKYLFMNIDR